MIFDNPNFINSSEAISDFIAFGNASVIIPYYNIALMDYNPINSQASFLNHAILVFENVQKIIVRSENSQFEIQTLSIEKTVRKEYLSVGGARKGMKGAEIEAYYANSKLFLPCNSIISTFSFTKIELNEDLPNDIKKLYGEFFFRLII